MKINFVPPYSNVNAAQQDKFAKWPTKKEFAGRPVAQFFDDALNGLRDRQKRQAQNARDKEFLRAGKALEAQREAERLDTQLGKRSA